MGMQNGTESVDLNASTEAGEAVETPGPEAAAGETPASESTGINPAWEPLREAIGEDFFNAHAMPVLKGMDESAHTRITNLNSQLKSYEPYQTFVDQKISPDDLQMAMQLRQMIEADPKAFYERLGGYLNQGEEQQQGEGLEEFGAGQENVAEIPPHLMARLEQAEKFQQEMLQQQQQAQQEQEFQKAVDEENTRLGQEMDTFIKNNPTFTEADKGELFRAQHELTQRLYAEGVNRLATVDEAAAEVLARAKFFNQRFGGGGAPGTLPTTTGGDIPAQQPNTSKMTKQDLESHVASLLGQSAQ